MVISELGLTYFDLICLGVLFVLLLRGYARGFLRELSGMLTWGLSLLGSKLLSYSVASMLYTSMGIGEKMRLSLTEIVSKLDFTSVETVRASLQAGLEKLSYIGSLIGNAAGSNWKITELVQSGSTNIETEIVNILMRDIEPVAHQVLSLVSFIGLFIILFIVCSFIFGTMRNIFTSIKIFGVTDKLLGGCLGLVKGCLFVIVFFSILFIVLSLIGSNNLSVLMDSKFFDIVTGIKNIIPK